ncbi:glycosyl hydrolase family 28-related protein [Pontiella sulfatireligans]|uniref:Rhamnogalacturonase A/B/Epimerase-like pectate lyase domain-containing protein n=1 Tax=Pontiella sulfatireligans TaxID=2750658 RepID=A0A6C2UJI9_9BACT|nr:glycosyl hydrolase family 28-related protein [Pontiella sulfatireligans]VGO19484.1 hypothetical protein SCARR_01543 [Pontiella sulfatireligans]
MNKWLKFICVAGVTGWTATASAVQVVNTVFPTDDVVIANAVLKPKASSKGDSERIQAAIDALSQKGGGVVFLQAGRYVVDEPIVVRSAVTLRGDWAPPTETDSEKGTVLEVIAGHGQEDALPTIMLHRDACIRDMTVYHPNQNPKNPVPYPWTISSDPSPKKYKTEHSVNDMVESNQSVINVTLINPYRGIRFSSWTNILMFVDRVFGTPLKTGFEWNNCSDIGRVYRINFSPKWWEESRVSGAAMSDKKRAALRSYLLKEGTACVFSRNDWYYVYDLNVEGYHTGIYTALLPDTKEVSGYGMMFGVKIQDCEIAIHAKEIRCPGMLISAGELHGRKHVLLRESVDEWMDRGPVQFNSCRFSSDNGPAIKTINGNVSLVNCTFANWKDAAIDLGAGAGMVVNCDFEKAGTALRIGPGKEHAKVISCRFKGKPGIDNQRTPSLVDVDHKQRKFETPETELMTFPADPRPAKNAVFDVVDYGASEEKEDNTAAFQKALDAAGENGGGVVYVPAGIFRFKGNLMVPAGVELRGCFEAPHHNLTAGSALIPMGGVRDPEGTPFIQLQTRSGIRGLKIFYSTQEWWRLYRYPWAVRSLGPETWVVYLTCGNADQGVDMGTHPSDGHYVKYLAGSFMRSALWASKSKSTGWIRDVHTSNNFTIWADSRLKPKDPEFDWETMKAWHGNSLGEIQRHHLNTVALGSLADEQVMGTFSFYSRRTLSFRDDYIKGTSGAKRGAKARVVNHAGDVSTEMIAAGGAPDFELTNFFMSPNTFLARPGIAFYDDFKGKASIFNASSWHWGLGHATIQGEGDVVLQQVLNAGGPIRVEGGNVSLEAITWPMSSSRLKYEKPAPYIFVGKKVESIRVLGNITPSWEKIPFVWQFEKGAPKPVMAGNQTPVINSK